MSNSKLFKYKKHFSSRRFWQKVGRNAQKIGVDLVYSALVLYYTLEHSDLPGWARAKIYAALGYLIFPVDAIPDWWPGGYVDDAGVIALALGAVAMYVTDEVKDQARDKLRDWFGAAADGAVLVT